MKKILLPLVLILFTVWMLPHVAAAANAQIEPNYTKYVDALGYLHIVGEVKNTGHSWLQFVKITATLKGEYGAVQDVIFAFTLLDRLPPGLSSGFDVVELDPGKAAATMTYSLALEYQPANPLPMALTLTGLNSDKDNLGYFEVLGEVTNNGTEPSNYTKIAATFYGADGNVVGVGFTFTDPTIIQPRGTNGFKLTFLDTTQSSLINSYSLAAQSQLYTSTP